jgi:hypothetical protein
VAASFSKGAAAAAAAAAAGGQQHSEAPGGGDGAPAAALSTACCHCGPLVAVQRSPFLEDVLLTVGDWTFQVWREGDAAPLFVSPYAPECYTGGGRLFRTAGGGSVGASCMLGPRPGSKGLVLLL